MLVVGAWVLRERVLIYLFCPFLDVIFNDVGCVSTYGYVTSGVRLGGG